ncbi:MAG: 6-phosphofructokinase [Oligoflexia bacterium]|nr:6-phosphofructokinase [Oligoflexia bacterium]
MKSLALLTSGGDGPGMNSAVRAIVRTAIGAGIGVWGVNRGYAGLLEGDMLEMSVSSVGNILQRGGTILKTSRCPEFMHKEARREAGNILRRKKIDALIVLGGNGSFNGAMLFYDETGIPVVGIPGSIDNDIEGSEYSIGFNTAVQTAVEAVDKIKDTAASHARIFIVEVMGRNSPAIALHVGVCTGAEYVVLPSKEVDITEVANQLQRGISRGKTSSIVIVAEGPEAGLSYRIKADLEKEHQLQSHVCILGHIQRGGVPTVTDRFIAAEMGHLAVKAILEGKMPTATVYRNGQVVLAPLEECLEKKISFDPKYIELSQCLSI